MMLAPEHQGKGLGFQLYQILLGVISCKRVCSKGLGKRVAFSKTLSGAS